MRIMFIAPGRSILSNNWASAMCNRGHEVHFVTQESFTDSKYSFLDQADPRFIIHQLPFHGKAGFFLNSIPVRRLTKLIQPDIIHVQQAAGYGLLGTFTDKNRAIVSVYGWEVYDLVNHWLWRKVISHNLHWYRYIGSTSHCMKEQIQQEFPDLKAPIYVTPFGINTSLFQDHHQSHKEIVIGTVKKMDKKYGIDYLIRSFAKAYRELSEGNCESAEHLKLMLVGPGEQTEDLKALAEQLGIADRTEFVGRVMHDQVPEMLNRFDIYMALSVLDSESFGVAILEAGACGCPVIVSDAGGLPEVVKNDVTGYVVPKCDVDAASARIIELVQSPETRNRMGKNGIKHVEQLYSEEICVDKMEQIYRKIITEVADDSKRE